MKAMQKIVSIIAVLALVCTLCLGVFAAGNTEPHRITITNGDATEPHQYQAFQVFTGIYTPEDMLHDVEWGNGVNGPALFEALVNNVPEFAQCTDAIGIAKVLEANYNNNDFVRLFASYVDKFLAAPVNAEPATATADSPAVIDVIGDGYYYVKDVTPALAQDTYSDYMIFVEGDVEIEAKDTTGVSSQKKVWDINDSNLEGPETGSWQDSGDYDIGDPVPFQLKGTVAADLDKYQTYKLVFHDVESEGLSFQPDTVQVYVDGELITEGYEVVTTCTDGCSFEIRFANLKAIPAVHGGSEITVEYFSILNEHAVIGNPNKPIDNYGNPNKMQMEYSNNPTASAEGENETGFTPWDEVIVYTYQVEINKIDQDGNPLHGAEFELYKWYLNEDVNPEDFTPDMVGNEEYGRWVKVETGAGADCNCGAAEEGSGRIIRINDKVATPVSYNGEEYMKIRDRYDPNLPEGDIYLKVTELERFESMLPAGITIFFMDENGAIVENASDFSYRVRIIEREQVGQPCHFWWAGVDDGWYKLVETVKPSPDYDDLDPIVFEIIADHAPEDPVVLEPVHGYVDGEPFFMPLDENIGIIHANIENHSGSHLPSTGGIGTTLFYVLGGMLVLGAGVLLVVKKFSDAK